MNPVTIVNAMEATWPPARTSRLGPWLLRDGKGGGKRVSATTLEGSFDPHSIANVEAAMRNAGLTPLFQLRHGQEPLDAALAELGYAIIDPVMLYAANIADLSAVAPPPMTTFPHWPPLGVAHDLWAEGGISTGRLAVMDRVQGPKCAILARIADRPSGVAFVALHQNAAILHALEVAPTLRRKGSAGHILQAAVAWAKDQGATDFGLAVTTGNLATRALYASFGLQVVGHYHYRQLAARKEAT